MLDPERGTHSRRARAANARRAWHEGIGRSRHVFPLLLLVQRAIARLARPGIWLAAAIHRIWLQQRQRSATQLLSHLPARLTLHTIVVVLTLLVLVGEGGFSLSRQVVAPSWQQQAAFYMTYTSRQERMGGMVPLVAPFTMALPPALLPRRSTAPADPLAPQLRVPTGEIVPAFHDDLHAIGPDETLGDLARSYDISLESLVWANGLQNGDVLVVGQELRIPRVEGIPYTTQEGDTLDAIGARFGVPAEIIAAGSVHLRPDEPLPAGQELFIPGSSQPLPETLLAQRGGLEGLANLGVQPAGIVRDHRTNMRAGPDLVYARVEQFEAGRRAALLARHENWLKVDIGGTVGWIRADMLALPEGLAATLPETSDFPAPPPIWVWPAHGALTSGFGPRWGSFHNGIDIANGAWTPIVAARSGTVREAGWCSGYGYCVKIDHGSGIATIYGHLIEQPPVSAGAWVEAGDVIGAMGSTYDRAGGGYSTGVHLHFTITVNGRAVDPFKFLP